MMGPARLSVLFFFGAVQLHLAQQKFYKSDPSNPEYTTCASVYNSGQSCTAPETQIGACKCDNNEGECASTPSNPFEIFESGYISVLPEEFRLSKLSRNMKIYDQEGFGSSEKFDFCNGFSKSGFVNTEDIS